MMRFKEGNKVEVWNRRDVPAGSWWSAEIVSGSGHNYFVRYSVHPTDSSMAVDRVPSTAIRPCPPPFGDLNELTSGDVVEVFDNNSWKLAEVLMAIDKKHYSVMLLGSSQEFKAHKYQIRRGLSWVDNQWMMICKDSGEQNREILSSQFKEGKFACHTSGSCEEMENSARKNQHSGVFLRDSKKRTRDICDPDMCNLVRRKTRRGIDEGRRCQRIITKNPRRGIEEDERVYNTACAGRLLDEEYMTGYIKNRRSKGMHSSNKQKSLVRSSKPRDCESTSSSVGSCSVSCSPCRSQQQHVPLSSQEMCSHRDHAGNSCGLECESPLFKKEEMQAVNHQLELQAYWSTLKAFYASGSGQSWRLLFLASTGLGCGEKLSCLLDFDVATLPSNSYGYVSI